MGLNEILGKVGLSMSPEQRQLDLYKGKLAANNETLSGSEQMMAMEKLKGDPSIAERGDWTGFPGYEAVQNQFLEKRRQQSIYQPQGMAQKHAKNKAADEKNKKEGEANPIIMGPNGFEPAVRSYKDFIASNIYKKKQMAEQGGGPQVSKAEDKWMNKYFGISDSEDGPEKPEDILRVRKLAVDMVKAEKIKNEGYVSDDYAPTEDEIKTRMPDATNFLYPDANVQQSPEKVKYDIELPAEVTTIGQAKEYLGKYMKPEEIDAWIANNVEAK